MSTQVTIHGKRTETIYPFTVRYKGETLKGKAKHINQEDERAPLAIGSFVIGLDSPPIRLPEKEVMIELSIPIEQAVKDYEKIHN